MLDGGARCADHVERVLERDVVEGAVAGEAGDGGREGLVVEEGEGEGERREKVGDRVFVDPRAAYRALSTR